MKPVHHLLFGFIVVMGFFVLFLPDSISWQIVFLAVVSGFLPDFDHREWLWKIVALALFIGFFAFFANSLYASMPGDSFLAAVGAFATAAIVSWAIYAAHPFRGDVFSLSASKTQFAGAEGWFLALYVLVVFAVTLSPAVALAAFLGYSSHWVLDAIAYNTYFGRRWLVNYPRPEKPMGWHVQRVQAEEREKRAKAKAAAMQKAALAKRKEDGREKKSAKGGRGKPSGKPSSKHAFFIGPGVTEESDTQPDLGSHSVASDEFIQQEEPEEHEEEAHGGSGAGH